MNNTLAKSYRPSGILKWFNLAPFEKNVDTPALEIHLVLQFMDLA